MGTQGNPEEAAKAHLRAILSGIDAADAPHRIELLKLFLARGLADLMQEELYLHDFFADCALLAGQNMQDVRLHELEERVRKLENPDAPTFAEMLVDVALLLAIELAVIGIFAYSVPALTALLSATASTAASRRRLLGLVEDGSVPISDETRRLGSSIAKKRLQLTAMERVESYAFRASPELRKLHSAAERGLRQDLRKLQDQVAFTRRVDRQGDELAQVTRAFESEHSLPTSEKWKKFLQDALWSTPVSRVAEGTGENLTDLLKRANQSPPISFDAPFFSSATTGAQLTTIRERRLEVLQDYGQLQALVQSFVSDEILENETMQRTAWTVVSRLPEAQTNRSLVNQAREICVNGFEAALWFAWLRSTGGLTAVFGGTFRHYNPWPAGAIVDGWLIQEEGLDVSGGYGRPSAFEYRGDSYPGVTMLSAYQADYLYHRFAKPYLAKHPEIVPSLIPYDPANYEKVRAQKDTFYGGFVDNNEKKRRIEELKLFVVLFFRHFFEQIENKETLGLFSDGKFKIRGWLTTIPVEEIAQENYADDAAQQQARKSAQEALQSLLQDSGAVADQEARSALAAIPGLIAALQLEIGLHDLLFAGSHFEPADAVPGFGPNDSIDRIARIQESLAALDAQIRAVEKQDPNMVRTYDQAYGEVVDELSQWHSQLPLEVIEASPKSEVRHDWRMVESPYSPPE